LVALAKCAKTWLGLDRALSVATGAACLDKYAVALPATVISSFSGAITGSTRIHRIPEEVGPIGFPGVFDTLSAKLVHRAGFSMAFFSGYSVCATAIGEPDMGLLSQTELIDRDRRICLSVPIPVIMDGTPATATR
jgi:hypothetical protein